MTQQTYISRFLVSANDFNWGEASKDSGSYYILLDMKITPVALTYKEQTYMRTMVTRPVQWNDVFNLSILTMG
jgi:hypothetical protein